MNPKDKKEIKKIEQLEFSIGLRKESLQNQIDLLYYQENILNQQKENIEKKRIQRKERIIAEMEAERLAEINRPPPSYYSSSPVQVPAPTVPTVPTVPAPVPVVRRPWYHRLADRIENHPLNRPAPPTAAQISRGRARRIRREESAIRREERSEERRKKKLKKEEDAYHKGLYEKQKNKLEAWYLKPHPNGTSIPDKNFSIYPDYHKTSNPEIRRIPKPYSYDNETETKKKKKPNLLKKLKRLLTQKNVIPRKKSPVPPPILPPVPPKILTLPPDYSSPNLPPAYSSRKYKLRSTQRDYNAGGMRSSIKKKTRRVKRS